MASRASTLRVISTSHSVLSEEDFPKLFALLNELNNAAAGDGPVATESCNQTMRKLRDMTGDSPVMIACR